jgi:hypothetical protein
MSTATVRAQLAAHLATGYGLTRESPEPVAFMRAASRSPVHLEFGVSLDSSQPIDGRKDLQSSECHVLIAYQLPPKDRVTGYDSMLTLDKTITDAVQLSAWANGPRLASFVWRNTSRTAGVDGWLWIDQTYTALHLLA